MLKSGECVETKILDSLNYFTHKQEK